MVPTTAVQNAAATLLAANAATLAPATDANVIALVMAPFTPNPTLVAGDLTLADFTGSTPIEGVTGTQPSGLDPATGQMIIDISPPAGGYRWETTDAVNLPQTIYGFALLSNDLSTLLASALLPAPVLLTMANQEIKCTDLCNLEFLPDFIS